MNNTTTVGRRLFWSVLSLFLLFAVLFIVFQQAREKEFKTEMLNLRLQDYNIRMGEALRFMGTADSKAIDRYVAGCGIGGLRVTLTRPDGTVFYDSSRKDYSGIPNHGRRKEIRDALATGTGYDISRESHTTHGMYFYSATYMKADGYIVRSALPYNDDLAQSLAADRHYIWFALFVVAALTAILYRFTHSLGAVITKLRIFARRADNNESLETEELAAFPAGELGEISEHIIKLYKRLQTTKEEQNVLKRQLTQNIAHELKTPAASIRGYLESITSAPGMDSATRDRFISRCYAQSMRLSKLLEDISALNRMDDAPELTATEELDVARTIRQIAGETATDMERRGMTLVTDIPDTMTMTGNPGLIYSIFRNLTDNALAYAGENTTVRISAHDGGDCWHFTFCDNGTGVEPEHLPRLFERFYRVDKGRSRQLGGTGLGLAIVKNAVAIHGGTITAGKAEGGGLCFVFALKKKNEP